MPVKEIHNHDYTRGMVRYTIHVEEDKAVKCGVRGIATSARWRFRSQIGKYHRRCG